MAVFFYDMNPVQAFNYERDVQYEIGHIGALVLAGKTFKADLRCEEPITGQTRWVVGVLSELTWEGGAGDAMDLDFVISAQNRQIAYELTHTEIGAEPAASIKLTVYDFDTIAKKYYEKFKTPTLTGCIKNKTKHADANWREQEAAARQAEQAAEDELRRKTQLLGDERHRLATWKSEFDLFVTRHDAYADKMIAFGQKAEEWARKREGGDTSATLDAISSQLPEVPEGLEEPKNGPQPKKSATESSDLEFSMNDQAEDKPASPRNWMLKISIVPGKSEQLIDVATGVKAKFKKTWGVPGSGA